MVAGNEQQLLSLDQQIKQYSSVLEHLLAARNALAGSNMERPVVAQPVPINRGRRSYSSRKSNQATGARRNGITPAGRKKIAQAMKKRWAERRAQKNTNQPQTQELIAAASS